MKISPKAGYLLVLLFLGGFAAVAQNAPTSRLLPGYLYPVDTSVPNKKIYVCGQRPVDLQGQVLFKGDLNAQLTLVFSNITKALNGVGMGPGNIRQISYRVTSTDQKASADNEQLINAAARQYFGQNKADVPSLSDIKNVGLQVDKDVVIEVEVVAIKE